MEYFQLFEITPAFRIDKKELKKKYFRLSKERHPDRHHQLDPIEHQSVEREYALINTAYETLMNDDRRLDYLLRRLEIISTDEQYALSPEFLMEMMEINEIKETHLAEAEQKLLSIRTALDQQVQEILEADRWEDMDESQKAKLKDYYYKRKYLDRAGAKDS